MKKIFVTAAAVLFTLTACAQVKNVNSFDVINPPESVKVKEAATVDVVNPKKDEQVRTAGTVEVSAKTEIAKASTAKVREMNPGEKYKDILEEIKKWDVKLVSLSTDFTQATYFEDVLITSSKGRLYYKKAAASGGLLKLEQIDADGAVAQIANTNKKIIRMTDGKGEHIMDQSWDAWAKDQPNKALFDFGNYTYLINENQVTDVQKTDGGNIVTLEPKNATKRSYSLKMLVGADYFPKEISVESEGMVTAAKLTNTKINPKIEDDFFGDFNVKNTKTRRK
ncbi:Outer membrane lipoprotein-sorting protein [Parelusimicrobium proximum]|uniref:LolA family protein n=1 Tax=Parelusimicrobium proximum TaxID=3228953 RepID=UPI003D16C59A